MSRDLLAGKMSVIFRYVSIAQIVAIVTSDMMDKAIPVSDWKALADGIRTGQRAAVEQFNQVFNSGIRFFIRKELGQQGLEDNVHDCAAAVIDALRETNFDESEQFVGFVRVTVKRYISDRATGETAVPCSEAGVIAAGVLRNLSSFERGVLQRYYVLKQPEGQICREAGIRPDALRNLKLRALQSFIDQAGTQTQWRDSRSCAAALTNSVRRLRTV